MKGQLSERLVIGSSLQCVCLVSIPHRYVDLSLLLFHYFIRDSGSIPTLWKKKMVTWFQRWDKDGDGVLTRKDFELLDQAMEEVCCTQL